MLTIHTGDSLSVLRTLESESVQCCVTSPPYYGLRDYNHSGQMGQEGSPDEFIAAMVEVFREVYRVLRPDGTCWVNMGDSYNADGRVGLGTRIGYEQGTNRASATKEDNCRPSSHDLKPKDLMGMPWRLAMALQQPYYTGKIRSEADRIWLAAIIDGEGCFFIHKRHAGTPSHSKFTRRDGTEANYLRTSDTFGVGLEICNTHKALIDRVVSIVGMGTFTTQSPEQNQRRKQKIWRWRLRPNEVKLLVAEIYPHLVAKQHQARLIYSCPSNGEAGAACHQAMKGLHNGMPVTVDFPAPPSMFVPGFYLRQDVIWSKPNCMPESVTDRCTKAHEYLFLLTKSRSYYYDQEAIREKCSEGTHARLPGNVNPPKGQQAYEDGQTEHRTKAGLLAYAQKKRAKTPAGWDTRTGVGGHGSFHAHGRDSWKGSEFHKGKTADHQLGRASTNRKHDPGEGNKNNASFDAAMAIMPDFRNKRSVWTVPSAPFKEAHFATFPPDLIKPCILAGTKPGDVVLDPFGGSGTTGKVALELGRRAVLIELNPEYVEIIKRRTAVTCGLPL